MIYFYIIQVFGLTNNLSLSNRDIQFGDLMRKYCIINNSIHHHLLFLLLMNKVNNYIETFLIIKKEKTTPNIRRAHKVAFKKDIYPKISI